MGRDNSRGRKTELLAPAGSLEILKAVAQAGADAVYAGGEKFGARAYAKNFTAEELREGLDYLHLRGKKLYLTVNTLVKEKEIGELWDYLLPLYEEGLDAVIVQDLGVLHFVREHFPGLPIHASTQMGVMGEYGARMMLGAGCRRIVVARELSLEEISDIYQKTEAELECFVHGSLCYCYSGQCLMSSMIGGRSGNRGRCAQPCRLPYRVRDSREGKADRRGKKGRGPGERYYLSPKDLCGIGRIGELIRSGVYSFKIEGRMKQAEYAAGVTRIYREQIDRYSQGIWPGQPCRHEKGGGQANGQYQVSEETYQELLELGNRSGFTDGYFGQHNGKEMMALDSPSHEKGKGKPGSPSHEKGKGKPGGSSHEKGKGKPGSPSQGKGKGSRPFGKGKEGAGSPFPGKGEGDKEKIKGILRLFRGNPAVLMLEYKGIEVKAEGEVVQPSQNQPLPEETVLEKMKKTGGTPFVFSELKVEMEEGVFLTIGALNQLRRKGLELLQGEILNGYRRELPEKSLRQIESPNQGKRDWEALNRGNYNQEDLRGKTHNQEDLRGEDGEGEGLEKGNHNQEDLKRGKKQAGIRYPQLRVLAETGEQCRIALEQAEVRRVYLEETVFLGQELLRNCPAGEKAAWEEGARRPGQKEVREDVAKRPGQKAVREEGARRPGQKAAWEEGARRPGQKEVREDVAKRTGQKEVREDYVEMLLGYMRKVKAAGKECYLALPYIFRKHTAGWFAAHWQEIAGAGLDGFLARNYEELQFLKERGVSPSAIQGDYPLYAYSQEALRELRGLPAGQFTLPVELNGKELAQLDAAGGEMVVYGRQPLMVSAQCLRRNAFSCDGKSGVSYLEDRLGNRFPVRNQCGDCYNVVYNISPLSLLHHYPEICGLRPSAVRISLTLEDAQEAGQVFGWYRQAAFGGGIRQEEYQKAFTNGHWKRGVE